MATAAPEIPVLARDQAFESLYRSYVKDVYHYALALLRNPADAEDVTQTTFMNAYRAYSRGLQVEKPQNWLIKIAHNVARTRYARASRRVKEVPLEDHVEQLAVPEENRPDVQGVLQALGRLPFNQRAALVMRELEGRTYVEIADTIGVSVSAVETLIFRARRSLRVKTSALRSLAAVPLPSSLTKLFGSGGVLAGGGGGVAGAGFVIKATMAIVAGVFATSLATGRLGPAAAGEQASRPAVGQSQTGAPDGTLASLQGTLQALLGSPGKAGAQGASLGPAHGRRSGQLEGGAAALQPAGAAERTQSGVDVHAPIAGVTSQAQPVVDKAQSVVDKAQPVVDTAQQTVATVVGAVPVPAPPVPAPPISVPQAPSLPPPPVDVPELPGIPLP
jgi:RNA polymerase sigma factor (sigma-70 family)